MEKYFSQFRKHIIGLDQCFPTPYNDSQKVIYADWTASGRCYGPIEDRLKEEIMPFVANTHTETSSTGLCMTYAYHKAQELIKKHVNASESDVMIACGSGMTGAVNKFQRILGFRIHERYKDQITISEEDKPVVFVSHMEHHSNQTSWLETIACVEIIKPNEEGLVCLEHLDELLEKYKHRKTKIAAITSCSNVTGIFTPFYEISKKMHEHGGLCFVDFACSGPYVNIDMHPQGEDHSYLDAIFFSPHKFLGGPGSSGILIFNSTLYDNTVPDNSGGGVVEWTNPWGEHKYVDDIEVREDGGTPAFLQTMRVALSIQLKDQMGVNNILKREEQQLAIIWEGMEGIPNLNILAGNQKHRLGIISFYIDDLHYNAGVKLLNDRFGIQTRGGCSCAGTYGHYLLNVDQDESNQMTCAISEGDFSFRPGWIRMSVHPCMTDDEVRFIVKSIMELAENHVEWMEDYKFKPCGTAIVHKTHKADDILKDRILNSLCADLGGPKVLDNAFSS
ncbi:MAG: selenocysteine lyase/cysteine desulfurase [Patiriisocius sp.]|jgi:selenocysteine lyase/cysteine desulfurase